MNFETVRLGLDAVLADYPQVCSQLVYHTPPVSIFSLFPRHSFVRFDRQSRLGSRCKENTILKDENVIR